MFDGKLPRTAEILLGAADYIEKNGLFKGHPGYDPTGKSKAVCASIAIRIVVGVPRLSNGDFGEFTSGQTWEWEIARFTMEKYLNLSRFLPAWSDAPGRTQEEVVAAFRRVAARVAA